MVGGGEVAARKVEMLRRAEARVTVVAPELCAALSSLVAGNHARHVAGNYSALHLDDQALVVAATDSESVNEQVARDAQARGMLVNVVDRPALCTFETT